MHVSEEQCASVCEREKEKRQRRQKKEIIVCIFWISTYVNDLKRAFEKEILSLLTLSLVTDCDYKCLIFFSEYDDNITIQPANDSHVYVHFILAPLSSNRAMKFECLLNRCHRYKTQHTFTNTNAKTNLYFLELAVL